MSISCYKNYSIVVSPAASTNLNYWKLENASTPFFDSVHGVGIGDSGGTSIQIGGIIGNGRSLPAEIIGAGTFLTSAATPLLAWSSAYPGLSLSFWWQDPGGVTSIFDYFSFAFGVGNAPGIIIFNTDIIQVLVDRSDNVVTNTLRVGGVNRTVFSTAYPSQGAWHLAVVTYKTSNKAVNFYIDGTSVGAQQISAAAFPTVVTPTLSMFTFNFNKSLIYYVDEIGYYWYDLSAAEVTALWNGGVGARPLGV